MFLQGVLHAQAKVVVLLYGIAVPCNKKPIAFCNFSKRNHSSTNQIRHMAQEGVINETSGAYYKIPGGNKKYDAQAVSLICTWNCQE